ncbi:MAG: YedE-related selenium metabolism membrane protein [Helicobacteraceae bacterium]|jgi:YedE family putative selenium metabolism protein|nr:YedE-related selenium metabolism membrane protein [Helicobacteraceae bacterium]
MLAFKEKIWIVATGIAIGAAGVFLVTQGNPANMGVCVACFLRDTAGALGLHGASPVQYLRPEIAGFVIGAFILAFLRREWAQPNQSAGGGVLVRFTIAFFIMLGCLVFLGCPLRMALRVAAGDLNAVIGLLGFFVGAGGAAFALKKGFSLGVSNETCSIASRRTNALIIPAFAVIILVLLFAAPSFIKFSESGVGAAHAPAILALVIAIVIGVLCHQSGFCISGGFRDIFLLKNGWSFAGYAAIIIAALIGNLIVGKFNLGFEGQPIAHSEALWNFLAMALVGYGSVLIGGCPLRQLIKAGQGDSNAGLCIVAFILAGATAHNFGVAASPAGVPLNGKIAVIAGLILITVFVVFSRKAKTA